MTTGWVRQQVGADGFARHAVSANEAAWLQNLEHERDGIFRARAGTKHIKTFGSDVVTDLSRPGGYNHLLMVAADGGTLYELDVESPGSPTTVDSGWPTTPFSSCLAVATSGQNVWVACKSAIGGSVGTLYEWDGMTLTALSPPSGNWVGMHLYMAMRAASGDGSINALRWTELGDITNWPASRGKGPIPELGTIDAVVPYSAQQTILLGPKGIGHVLGSDPANLSFEPLQALTVLTPMHHVARCRDRIIFLAAGPRIMQFVPPGTLEDIGGPIGRDLYLPQGGANLRAWYDPIRDYYCLSDRISHITYCYSLTQGRWVGVFVYTETSDDFLGSATIDQGASAVDAATMPWGKQFVGVGKRVLQWDPSVATDATDGSTNAAFVCAVETPPICPDPSLQHHVHEVQVEGVGSYDIIVKGRNTPSSSYTSHVVGSVTAPGRKRVNPQTVPAYRELAVRLEANSTTALRFKSLAYRVGASRRP